VHQLQELAKVHFAVPVAIDFCDHFLQLIVRRVLAQGAQHRPCSTANVTTRSQARQYAHSA